MRAGLRCMFLNQCGFTSLCFDEEFVKSMSTVIIGMMLRHFMVLKSAALYDRIYSFCNFLSEKPNSRNGLD
jgi:hypothetical protein